MNEKLMKDLLKSFPCELIEEGLKYVDREIGTGNRRLDLAFLDKRNRLLLVEVQKDSLDTKHIDRHIDFVEGFLEKNPDVDLRLMYIANRIDPLRKSFLERRGYEYLEIHASKFMELAKKHNMMDKDDYIIEHNSNTLTSRTPINMNIDKDEIGKRAKFISYKGTKNEMEFWKIFFEEIDKRSFVKLTFQVSEFGVHVTNKKHFNSSGGKYSLMFTRNNSFKMNDLSFQGQSWNGLNRMKNWCITLNLQRNFIRNYKTENF
ncbi:MAG TPA: endonuclease NucS domain-containing protein [Draconibacterium sp.]|nr:endonuclease NucS domain-containing protein [Draconibacterium sp.]